MYESFYGLKEKPFTLLPDPEYLYLSPKHQRALTLLEYGMMNQAGFSVICGDTGAGKTTLIRRLLAELEDDTTVGLITNTHQSFGELLNWVLMAFGLDADGMSKSQMHQAFIQFLIEQYARNKHAVLIVDEAQNMNAETLEELRMLSNINADKDQVLQVILAGQPALRDTLRKPELMQFAQRIAVDYYLESLSQEETRNYIHHRLEVAGATHNIFTDEACDTVFKYSGGTPRLINLLCDTSLVYGFAEQTPQIESQLVEDVVREQHAHSIVPAFNMPRQENSTPQQQLQVEKPVEARADDNAAIKPAQEELETVIAELGQRARQAVSNFDSAARAVAEEVRESIHEKVEEIKSHPGKESKVTPIHQDVSMQDTSQHRESASKQNQQHSAPRESVRRADDNNQPAQAGDPKNRPASDHDDNADEDFLQQDDVVIEPASSGSNSHDYRQAHQHSHYEDTYPIIHVDNNNRKNASYLILGIAGGMFAATIIMVIAGYFMFFGSSMQMQAESPRQATPETPSQFTIQREQEIERARMEALQKERDAALAMTRAMERERDAALAAAKAQEEMRAAERRAAEMVAQQERRTAQEIKRAQELARQAEIAAIRASERERLAKEEAEQARIEAEKVKAAAAAAEATPDLPVATPAPQPPTGTQTTEVVEEAPAKPAGSSQREDINNNAATKFSANPCNSASAKFLSTCKK
jgi:type II secretory pathway predicted ATPase ExeA